MKKEKKNLQKRLWGKKKDPKNIDDNNLILDQKFQLSLFGLFVFPYEDELDFWLYYLFRVWLIYLLVISSSFFFVWLFIC